MFFNSNRGVFGLDIGSSSIKAVELDGKLNNLKLANLGFENLPSDAVVDGQIMELGVVSEVIQNICNSCKIRKNKVIASVSGHSVIIKNIVLPKMEQEELEESIDWHAEEHIPYDLSEVSLDYHVGAEDDESMEILLAACKREKLDNIRQTIQLAGKEPTIIDVDTFALQNCYEINYHPEEAQVVTILNIGASTMNINIVQGTKSIFTRDVTMGGSQFTDILQRSLGYSFKQAEAVKRGATDVVDEKVEETAIEALLENANEGVAMEVRKTFDFYRTTTEEDEISSEKIFLSGGGSKVLGLKEDLQEELATPVEFLNPFLQINVNNRKFDPDYLNEIMPEMAVAVGLAIRGVG